jgi:hypothetical protein
MLVMVEFPAVAEEEEEMVRIQMSEEMVVMEVEEK